MENEHRPSDSPYIERVYRSDGVSATGRMHSVASTHWELAVWTHRGSTHVAVRGPETRPSTVPVLPDISPFGILFAHGAAMPHLPIPSLVDSALRSPHVTARAFVLGGQEWELPSYDNAEDFALAYACDRTLHKADGLAIYEELIGPSSVRRMHNHGPRLVRQRQGV